MKIDLAQIKTYFAVLGLEPEIADMYLVLQARGPLSISELSRESGIERVRIYRLMDAIKASTLLEIETRNKPVSYTHLTLPTILRV